MTHFENAHFLIIRLSSIGDVLHCIVLEVDFLEVYVAPASVVKGVAVHTGLLSDGGLNEVGFVERLG